MARKDTVAIVYEESVPLFVPNCVTQLLQRPRGAGMRGDITMNEPTTVMLNHNKDIQQTKGCCYDNEEIAGYGSPCVQA